MLDLKTVNNIIKRQPSIKLLEVILGEHASWKSHIKTTENKMW